MYMYKDGRAASMLISAALLAENPKSGLGPLDTLACVVMTTAQNTKLSFGRRRPLGVSHLQDSDRPSKIGTMVF